MQSTRQFIQVLLGVLCLPLGVATVFFLYYGVRIVYAAATVSGEGSLGHVGLYIAAVLYPVLALFFGGLTFVTFRAWRRRLKALAPDRR